MRIELDSSFRLRAESILRVDLPASTLWGQMRDWRRFLTIDPLHVRLFDITPAINQHVPESMPRADAPQHSLSAPSTSPQGTTFNLVHCFCALRVTRRGRILSWHEGRGYAISDLSRRGPGRGFPHVCAYHVEPDGPDRSRLFVRVRGRWTARWIPRPVIKLWITWVLRMTEARLHQELSAFQAWRRSASQGQRRSTPLVLTASAPTPIHFPPPR